jgi:hypothetical protein
LGVDITRVFSREVSDNTLRDADVIAKGVECGASFGLGLHGIDSGEAAVGEYLGTSFPGKGFDARMECVTVHSGVETALV